MKLLVLLFIAFLSTLLTIVTGDDKRVVCYFASWTVYRTGKGSFDVKDIDASLCTHINFGFIGLNEDASIHILDDWESGSAGYNGFNNLVALKNSYPKLKVLVSMGGWNEGSAIYSTVSADPIKRKFLAQNVLAFIKEHSFDGFDLDWEYPGSRFNPSDSYGFNNLVGLKNSYPDLKVLVSMGGWNEGSTTYSTVSADPIKRKILAQNVLAFIQEHSFDGFDLDWEYPGLRGGNIDIDKDDFTKLLQELSNVLKPEGYLLTAAVAGAVEKIDTAYDARAIDQILDYYNVMVFDFHGAFDPFVGHVSPLYPAPIDYEYYENSTYNVETGINHWISIGATPEKLNLGIITYGRSFTLADKNNNTLFAPILGGGIAGPYSAQIGILGYNEICEFHLENSTYIWDEDQKVPHRLWDDQWVGYEDEFSIKEKMDFALEKDLGGAMMWSFDYDDFRGTCGEKYKLLKAINKGIKNL